MRWLSRTVHSPIGLDVGRRVIKAVQLSGWGKQWQVEAVGIYPRTHPQEPIKSQEIEQLHDMLAMDGFRVRGQQVVLGTPHDMLLTSMLELPPKESAAPLERIARLEMARLHHRDPGQIELACWDIPPPARGKQANHMMAVACAHQDAGPWLDMFEKAGLAVQGMDIQPWALARACCWGGRDRDASRPGLLLDLGWSAARLVAVHGGVVVYAREISDGGLRGLIQTMMSRLGRDAQSAEKMVYDVGVTLPPPEVPEAPAPGSPPGSPPEVPPDPGNPPLEAPLEVQKVQEVTSEPGSPPREAPGGAFPGVLPLKSSGAHPGAGRSDTAVTLIADHYDSLAEELRASFSFLVHRYPNAAVQSLVLVGGGAGVPGLDQFLSGVLKIEVSPVRAEQLAGGLSNLEASQATALATAVGLALFAG